MANTTLSLDDLTTKHTSFCTFEELIHACKADNYIPTIIIREPCKAEREALATAIEAAGYKVFRV